MEAENLGKVADNNFAAIAGKRTPARSQCAGIFESDVVARTDTTFPTPAATPSSANNRHNVG